ncbi:hypothetical protein FYK55_16935 [Roseiconus nitratireducens]|uniref:Competence protein CoiA nuclease-like domain-containing protein n=1 Tax=Roseiconus nitratireducens TaxID=2605748 RepID=A0A5M6D6L2_9BACT|nr:hypothetical protein FYK55_16935 [Roseiconus nitratireducens]
MPLKAIVNDDSVIAPLLSEDQWQDLRSNLRKGHLEAILPCCGRRCFARESKLGTRHFYHVRRSGCNTPAESLEHLRAKEHLAIGGAKAGWQIDVEVSGDGWRADVLATRNESKVAFEVQWSSQTLNETERRHARYVGSGIRCAWLFRKIPKGALPNRDVPMFEINCDDRSIPKVMRLPLSEFGRAMLSGKFRFCDRTIAASRQVLDLEVFDYDCWKCNRQSHVFQVSNDSHSPLSRHGDPVEAYLHDGFPKGPEYCPEAFEYLDRLKRDSQWSHLLFGEIKDRYSRAAQTSYLSQGCPHCDAIFGEHYLGKELLSKTPILCHQLVARLEVPIVVDQAHWCYSPTRSFCC